MTEAESDEGPLARAVGPFLFSILYFLFLIISYFLFSISNFGLLKRESFTGK
jgi:hypothetical protein